mmetsp:Transcript_27338/g.31426  ORF Transcript_27338/g.31426 Transcript_27338/m.31426 type:complete len:93 (+) Transcript_27338:843-1121(+)
MAVGLLWSDGGHPLLPSRTLLSSVFSHRVTLQSEGGDLFRLRGPAWQCGCRAGFIPRPSNLQRSHRRGGSTAPCRDDPAIPGRRRDAVDAAD